MKYKISGTQNKSVAPLTLHGASMKTVPVTRRKLFLAAKAIERRANMQFNKIDNETELFLPH